MSYTQVGNRKNSRSRKVENTLFDPVTFFEYVSERHSLLYETSAEFSQLYMSIAMAIKAILVVIEKFMIKQLSEPSLIDSDLIKEAEDAFVNQITAGKACSVIVSCSSPEPINIDGATGRYVVVVNPLSGTALHDTMTPMGTVFSIFRQLHMTPSKDDFLRPSTEMVGAGYALYSCQTLFVVNLGYKLGLAEFMLDEHSSEFVLVEENIKIPKTGHIYSIDEGDTELWDQEALLKYVLSKKDPRLGAEWDLHYSGSFVLDMHVIIKKGGILLMPKNTQDTAGRLSVVFHAGPMAFVLREAGGAASSGLLEVTHILPSTIRQTTPFFAGSQDDVSEFVSLLNDVRISFNVPWEEECLTVNKATIVE